MPKIATLIAVATAATAIAFTAPAMAAPVQGSTMKAKIIQRNGETLYCVKETVTGSRVPNRTCLTKQEWELRGSIVAAATSDHRLASNPQVANRN